MRKYRILLILSTIVLINFTTACRKTKPVVEKEKIVVEKPISDAKVVTTSAVNIDEENDEKRKENQSIKNYSKNIDFQNMDAKYFIGNEPKYKAIIMNPDEIKIFNDENIKQAKMLYSILDYPEKLDQSQVKKIINSISSIPKGKRYKENGEIYLKSDYDNIIQNTNINQINSEINVKYAVVTNRTILRTFPTDMIAASRPGNNSFDRFTETAVYPSEPLVVLHMSLDKKWYFVQMYNYNGWIQTKDIAFTDKETLRGYIDDKHFVVISEPKINIAYKYGDEVINTNIDMGVKMPTVEDAETKNYVLVKIPIRNKNGNLEIKNINIDKSYVVKGYLPYSRENILKQAFKFSGEYYGWGGLNLSRDCSGFIMDIFRCFGITLPRNSSEQGKYSLGKSVVFEKGESIKSRKDKLDSLLPGSALYMPGHVMLYLGKFDEKYYVIHDFTGYYIGEEYIEMMKTSITDLEIKSSDGKSYLEKLYAAKDFNIK